MTEQSGERPIESLEDARAASAVVEEFTVNAGFEIVAAEEVALAARELCLNLVHHADGGEFRWRRVERDGRHGVELAAVDWGGGIPDVEQAFRDGFTTRGSFGYGLGTVNRMMHTLEVTTPRPGGHGTEVRACRWRYVDGPSSLGRHLNVGIASRPHPGYRENGDAVLVTSWERFSLVAVIDGLGHGPAAHRAARAARSYVASHAREALETIFRGTDRACAGTRGVVMLLVRFDWAEETVTMGSVGNVELRVFGTDERPSFVVRRGFLGRGGPRPAVRTAPWPREATMVAHTDGIRSTELPTRFRGIAGAGVQEIARRLLVRQAKEHDDATIVLLHRREDP